MTNQPQRILIVDDEPAVLKMMGVFLGRLGYQVVAAGSTEKAWAEVVAAPQSFSLVVLDATMSGIPLEELAGAILSGDPLVKVIAASGYPVDIAALLEAAPGRVMFLHKPFTPQMLGGAVRRMLAT